MRRVYIQLMNGFEGAKEVGGKIVPAMPEIWLDNVTGHVFKKAKDGSTWGHLLHLLAMDHQVCEFPEALPEKTLMEVIRGTPEASIPAAIVEAPEGIVNPPKTATRGPYKKKSKQGD
jgi:putative heme iron utilization protein